MMRLSPAVPPKAITTIGIHKCASRSPNFARLNGAFCILVRKQPAHLLPQDALGKHHQHQRQQEAGHRQPDELQSR